MDRVALSLALSNRDRRLALIDSGDGIESLEVLACLKALMRDAARISRHRQCTFVCSLFCDSTKVRE